jgi:hypothetical protein|tara:strand:+ start:4348 stop:5802 length:1455 start_codon:yes stop_codon:yes gene_type:complete
VPICRENSGKILIKEEAMRFTTISSFIMITGFLIYFIGCQEEPPTTSTEGEIDQIVVTPLSAAIEIDSTVQLLATAYDTDGEEIQDVIFTWVSSDSDVATVDLDGLVTGANCPSASITASAEGFTSNSVEVSVISFAASIEITPLDVSEYNWNEVEVSSQMVAVGMTASLSASVLDSCGNTVPEAQVDWVLADPSFASVDASGIVTGLSKGITTVKGTYETETGTLESLSLTLYVVDEVFSEEYSSLTDSDDSLGYFITDSDILWQVNYEWPTDTSDAGPKAGSFHIVEDGGDNVLMMTAPTTAYYANRQILVMTYGNSNSYNMMDAEHGWPDTTGKKTKDFWRVEMRFKVPDDLASYTTAEVFVTFTQYFSGGTSPYYMNYAIGRNRASMWFGTGLAPDAKIPDWGAMPEIEYGTWVNTVIEMFDGVSRTEVYTGTEPTGNWSYSYAIPEYETPEEYIPGLWLGTFNVDTMYVDDIRFYSPYE